VQCLHVRKSDEKCEGEGEKCDGSEQLAPSQSCLPEQRKSDTDSYQSNDCKLWQVKKRADEVGLPEEANAGENGDEQICGTEEKEVSAFSDAGAWGPL
jgi:hypothetical protein